MGGVQTMVLYIKTNIHHSILFSPPSHFKGTFTIFPQGHFIMTPPPPENLEKYLPPLFISPPTSIKHKRPNTFRWVFVDVYVIVLIL